MTENADRVYQRKRIKDPGNDNTYVDIPVLYQAKIRTAAEQYQDRWLYLRNDSAATRDVRVQRVRNPATNDYVDCERLGGVLFKTVQEQAQEHKYILVNNDPPPIQPTPGANADNPSHEAKHVVRYYKDNDPSSSIWVDVEIMDELKVTSPTEFYQGYHIYLRNPDLGQVITDDVAGLSYVPTLGLCDPSLDLAPAEPGILDPPYRLDPFQNIVNVQFMPWVILGFNFGAGNLGGDHVITASNGSPPSGHQLSDSYLDGTQLGRLPSASSGTITVGTQTLNWTGAPINPATYAAAPYTLLGFTSSPQGIKTSTSFDITGSPYLQFPNATSPESGWVTATAATVKLLGWIGTGPYTVLSGPLNVMALNATVTQFNSDFDPTTGPGGGLIHTNGSIYVYGDTLTTAVQDFSALVVTSSGGGATWLPVAIMPPTFLLKDGTPVVGAGGLLRVLCKRVAPP